MTTPTSGNGPSDQNPHFVLVPLMAPGHLIPMMDMARLLASHGATVTVVTTPLSASRVGPSIHRISQSGLPVQLLILPFPSSAAGLPDGCESVDAVPSVHLLGNFVEACAMLREPLLLHLRHRKPRPSCMITDACQPWTRAVARELALPRLIFHGYGCFPLLCRHMIISHKILESVTDENEPFVVPELPHRVGITKAKSPHITGPAMYKFYDDVREAESTADGVVVNSFDDLEPCYVASYQKAVGKPVWTIGPVSLCNGEVDDMAARGGKASIDKSRCLSWLDSREPGSVLYVSFGSLATTMPWQLREIGLGLEASNCPFVWVIKAGDKSSEVEEWLLSERFEERVGARGLVIRGWAPQVMILSHPAVGGFMTHCGWNSTLESVSTGVPMATWPHFKDQFLNEMLVVEMLGVGIPVGVKFPTKWGVESREVLVTREDVMKAVKRLMDGGEDGKWLREKARELGEKAVEATKRGSSYQNIQLLVQKIRKDMWREE